MNFNNTINTKNTSTKRTATITFQQAINYGAVLQMFALQTAICSLNYKNEILNYDCPAINREYQTSILDNFSNMKSAINSILHVYIRWKRNRKFSNFIKNNITISPLIQKEDLHEQGKKYSVFIVGSDQVWNYLITQSDGSYFLDFVADNSKKCSYAASFGISDIPDEKKAMYFAYLNNFHIISVREYTGAALVKSLTYKEAFVDLDPVFLLGKDEWGIMCHNIVPEKYILVYTVGIPVNVYQYTKKMAQITGLKIVNIRYGLSLRNKTVNIGDCFYTVGPDEFVNFIRNAEIVVTNSFHATAFSIIFNKEFYVEICDNLGSRISDLLTDLKIEGRYFRDSNLLQARNISWETINNILALRREVSMRHLKEILESGDE